MDTIKHHSILHTLYVSYKYICSNVFFYFSSKSAKHILKSIDLTFILKEKCPILDQLINKENNKQ